MAELHRQNGNLREISRRAQMSYDTVHRIKNRENDPGYSKVRALADVLGIVVDVRPSGIDGGQPEREAA